MATLSIEQFLGLLLTHWILHCFGVWSVVKRCFRVPFGQRLTFESKALERCVISCVLCCAVVCVNTRSCAIRIRGIRDLGSFRVCAWKGVRYEKQTCWVDKCDRIEPCRFDSDEDACFQHYKRLTSWNISHTTKGHYKKFFCPIRRLTRYCFGLSVSRFRYTGSIHFDNLRNLLLEILPCSGRGLSLRIYNYK